MLQETTGESEGGGSGQTAGCFPDIYDGQDFKNWLDGSYIGELLPYVSLHCICLDPKQTTTTTGKVQPQPMLCNSLHLGTGY